jgi:hypothetical protein
MDSLARPRNRKRDMRFGMWNVRILYMAGSLKKTDAVIVIKCDNN